MNRDEAMEYLEVMDMASNKPGGMRLLVTRKVNRLPYRERVALHLWFVQFAYEAEGAPEILLRQVWHLINTIFTGKVN